MTILDTLLSILKTPGEIGVMLLRMGGSVADGGDMEWIIAVVFWLAVSAFVLKLR